MPKINKQESIDLINKLINQGHEITLFSYEENIGDKTITIQFRKSTKIV